MAPDSSAGPGFWPSSAHEAAMATTGASSTTLPVPPRQPGGQAQDERGKRHAGAGTPMAPGDARHAAAGYRQAGHAESRARHLRC